MVEVAAPSRPAGRDVLVPRSESAGNSATQKFRRCAPGMPRFARRPWRPELQVKRAPTFR
eukprot:14262458-Alexandrium_andersonii.AAC.1